MAYKLFCTANETIAPLLRAAYYNKSVADTLYRKD